MEKRGAHEMRRAPCSIGTSVETAMPHCKKDQIDRGVALDLNNSSTQRYHGGSSEYTGQSAATAQEEIRRQAHR